MGGLVIEKIRPGVEFTPDAAAAFRRADAQVRKEFGRGIDVNSTYRSWATQLKMYDAWNRYVRSGYNPAYYPGHSKALHPSDPLAFHVKGTALDSDDWTNARIREILAQNGFIRNRPYVPNENHHFEYIRSSDKNYGKPTSGGASKPKPKPIPKPIESEEDDMEPQFIAGEKKGTAGTIYQLRNDGKKRKIPSPEWTARRAIEKESGEKIHVGLIPDTTLAQIPNA